VSPGSIPIAVAFPPRRSLDLFKIDLCWMSHSDLLELMEILRKSIENYKDEPLHGPQSPEETVAVSVVAEDPVEEPEASTRRRSECASQTDEPSSE
jgi:hypothetical protein